MLPMVWSHEGQGAVQRAPGEYGDRGGRTGREQPHWQRWGSQDGPGWPVPQEPEAAPASALSPAHCVGFWGSGQTERQQHKACTRLSPTELQLPGEAPPSCSSCRVCSCYIPTPGAPSRHILCIPHEQPAPPWSQAVAHDASPQQAQPWQPPGACAKGKARGMPRVTAAAVGMACPQARGVCAPHALPLAAACVSSCVGSPLQH